MLIATDNPPPISTVEALINIRFFVGVFRIQWFIG
jgi:hypothetical protein